MSKPPADFGTDDISQAMKPIDIEKIKAEAFAVGERKGRINGLREAAKICGEAPTSEIDVIAINQLADKLDGRD
jgi:hypothetical protein